jgi:hypothetical protein
MAASAETPEWDVTVPLVIQVFVVRLVTRCCRAQNEQS